MNEPVAAKCHVLRAKNDSGPRVASQLKWIVLHSTEGGNAEGVAAMNARGGNSETIVVDDQECWRMLPDLVIPWAAPGANTNGLHIEHCGFARWSRVNWLMHEPELRRSAFKAARWAHKYGIPLRWVGKYGLRLGRKGVTTHADVTKAFPGGSHTDPGPGFPKDKWMLWAKQYLNQLEGGDL